MPSKRIGSFSLFKEAQYTLAENGLYCSFYFSLQEVSQDY